MRGINHLEWLDLIAGQGDLNRANRQVKSYFIRDLFGKV